MKVRSWMLLLGLLLLAGCAREPIPTDVTQETSAPTLLTEEVTEALDTEPETTAAEPEETEPTPEPQNSDLVAVAEYIPDILVELKYATSDNFTGQEIYAFSDVYLRYGTVKKLAAAQEELNTMGLRLKIWDGFRPVFAQFRLWEICPDPVYVSNPNVGFSSHSRGNTVDLTVADAYGHELIMPTGFDDFSNLADRDYSDCPADAAENAQLLEAVMESHGFTGYVNEWWHYSDETEYPVESCFDPAVISQWYADCQEYISLRVRPDTTADTLTRIPAGETLTLLGYDDDFAMVEYAGQRGYVLTAYIAPLAVTESEKQEGISLNCPLYRAVCENYISLRSEPDVSSGVITQIPNGGVFILLERYDNFALVDYNGLYGYVLENYIEPV